MEMLKHKLDMNKNVKYYFTIACSQSCIETPMKPKQILIFKKKLGEREKKIFTLMESDFCDIFFLHLTNRKRALIS